MSGIQLVAFDRRMVLQPFSRRRLTTLCPTLFHPPELTVMVVFFVPFTLMVMLRFSPVMKAIVILYSPPSMLHTLRHSKAFCSLLPNQPAL